VGAKKNKNAVRRQSSAKSAAPGPYLGYALQPVRLCYYLLSAEPDSYVSIEHLDDVAVRSGAEFVLEQTKSALSQNPVSDWSPELWKTFANWIETIESGHAALDSTEFRLYVTPHHTGEIVQMLSDAGSDSAADQAVVEIKQRLSKLPKAPAALRYLSKLLKYSPEKRRTLIKQFRFESVHDDPVDALRKLFRAGVSESVVDTCCHYAIGRAKEEADSLIRDGIAPEIKAGSFRQAVNAFVRKNNLNSLLVSMTPPPAPDAIAKTLEDAPPFVRQLEIIDLSRDLQLRAVSDFLQTSANKTKWAESGEIVRESLSEMDNELVGRHGLIQLELEATSSHLPANQHGQVLYARCSNSNVKLEGREVPAYFVPGSYNDLANRLTIGWHPDYMTLLTDPKL
jgi:hypothetical protein